MCLGGLNVRGESYCLLIVDYLWVFCPEGTGQWTSQALCGFSPRVTDKLI